MKIELQKAYTRTYRQLDTIKKKSLSTTNPSDSICKDK